MPLTPEVVAAHVPPDALFVVLMWRVIGNMRLQGPGKGAQARRMAAHIIDMYRQGATLVDRCAVNHRIIVLAKCQQEQLASLLYDGLTCEQVQVRAGGVNL